MSESGGSQPQDDSDEDIYKDFSDFNFGDELAKLEHSKETIKKEAFDLSEQVKVLTKENEGLKKSNEILKRNMSSLLKTAQAEVQRKDSMIEELRNKLDSFAFRRKSKTTKDVYTTTQDLEFNMKLKNNRENREGDKRRSNSKKSRTSSDSDKKFHQEEHKKREPEGDREGSCDNNRKFGSFRDCTRRKSKHSLNNHEGFKRRSDERRSLKSTNNSPIDYRNSFTENHRNHTKRYSLDRRKRSRSSDRKFTNRRRNSRERRSGRMEESPERWRREKKEDLENVQRKRKPSEEDGDWALSFKNERRDAEKPMTLYSKRMMQKLTETKKVEKSPEEKTEPKPTEVKNVETEKEPGELTDDENVIESSKEFQELTKVAIIESAIIEKPNETETFKEPMAKEVKTKPEVVKNKPEAVEEVELCKPEIGDVIEYSPFKNNYKLIEISPIKPPDKEQLKEMYNKRTSTGQIQKEVESSIFNLLSSLSGVPVASKTQVEETQPENKQPEEKKPEEKVQNDKIAPKSKTRKKCDKKPEKDEKSVGEESKSDEIATPGDTTQFLDFFLLTTSPLKKITPGHPETPGKTQNDANSSDPPKVDSSSEVIEEKNSKNDSKSEEEKKEVKKQPKEGKKNENKTDGKGQKRKRESESEQDTKKRKKESGSESEGKKTKPENPRKRTRSQNFKKTEPETETKMKEDITTFEFFKPIAKKENLNASTECKMTTMNIVCLETPSKGVKNLMINEQMILNVVDAKNPALCSPLMTPRRMLKNDLMLTDSEDDSGNKGNGEEEEEEGEEEEEEEEMEMSESENSECGSDSGASDFVDLL